jgi:hypothetical protein
MHRVREDAAVFRRIVASHLLVERSVIYDAQGVFAVG